MFPLKDDNPTEMVPVMTLLLIAACAAAWVFLQGAGMSPRELERSVCALGAIPAEITGSTPRGPVPCGLGGFTWQALVSSMFLHGGWAHLIGNLWFLWIFGNNVEDSMGHLRFLVFYLLTGLTAAGAHILTQPDSALPMVGASGAISGVMGAYLVLFPRARVRTLLVLIVFITLVDLPAFVYLGYWFVLQLLSSSLDAGVGGGVAFAAHVGGFVAGVVLVLLFRNPELVRAKRAGVRLPRDRIPRGGWM
jgi:membrane associated rhomboid family serine protease